MSLTLDIHNLYSIINHGTPRRIQEDPPAGIISYIFRNSINLKPNTSAMKRFLTLTLSLLLCYSTSAQDFRKASWGDSKTTVKASESNVEWKTASAGIYDILGFKATIVGLSTSVGYLFVDDQLVRAKYSFTESHSNRNIFIDDFDSVGESLETKYGKVDRREFWRNDLYKDDRSDYGMAVAVGHYTLARQWEIPNKTKLIQLLSGDNYEISHVVEYSSIAFKDFVEQKEKAAEADVF